MRLFNKFVWSNKEPQNKNDIWFDGSVFKIYKEGDWQAFTLRVEDANDVIRIKNEFITYFENDVKPTIEAAEQASNTIQRYVDLAIEANSTANTALGDAQQALDIASQNNEEFIQIKENLSTITEEAQNATNLANQTINEITSNYSTIIIDWESKSEDINSSIINANNATVAANDAISNIDLRIETQNTNISNAVTNLDNALVEAITRQDATISERFDEQDEQIAEHEEMIGNLEEQQNSILTKNSEQDSRIESIESILAENYQVYGVRHNYNASSPTLTRIGNLVLHRTLPVQSKMRRCILDDNGDVVYYLDRANSTLREDGQEAVLDGTHGQVMVEIPEHYRACVEDTTNGTYDVLISLTPFTGARKIKKTYVSAFEAVVDRTDSSNLKLSSVRNLTEAFRGGNNNAAYDGTYRSFLGMPTTVVSLTNFRTYAKNRGENWHQYDWEAHCAIYWLFAIEYATLNSQAAFNADLDANGYHQGGLGAGVTNMNGDYWNAYNGYYPFVPCGYTLSLGDATGIVPLTFNAEQEVAYGAAYTTDVPSYRGIENPFGHIWKWTDGCKAIIQSETDGGLSEFYVCDEPANFTSSGTTNYALRGNLPRGNGYVKSVLLGEYGEIMPAEVGGGSTTYFCDYFYTNIPESGVSERGVLFGGNANRGADAGFVCATANLAPSATHAYFGSRLCWSAE